jgi:TonB family protein
VLVCTLMLGVVVAKHFQLQQRSLRVHTAPKVAAAQASESASLPKTANEPAAPGGTASQSPAPASQVQQANGITIRPAGRGDASAVPPGGLRIYDNGKEVFRLTPAPIPSDPEKKSIVQPAAAIEPEQVVQLSPEAAEGILLHRVEPEYPEQARSQKIQGAVVLDVRITASGAVQHVQVLSGDPLLAQASTDAVKQWRYKPHTQNGYPAPMQTQVTLNFRLPQ